MFPWIPQVDRRGARGHGRIKDGWERPIEGVAAFGTLPPEPELECDRLGDGHDEQPDQHHPVPVRALRQPVRADPRQEEAEDRKGDEPQRVEVVDCQRGGHQRNQESVDDIARPAVAPADLRHPAEADDRKHRRPDEDAAHHRHVMANVWITRKEEALWVHVGKDMGQEGGADVQRRHAGFHPAEQVGPRGEGAGRRQIEHEGGNQHQAKDEPRRPDRDRSFPGAEDHQSKREHRPQEPADRVGIGQQPKEHAERRDLPPCPSRPFGNAPDHQQGQHEGSAERGRPRTRGG